MRSLGPYRVLGRLGEGGMGQVFLAVSPGGRHVAVKLIRAELADDSMFRARFRREVAAARQVSGAFTVPVLDADVDAEVPWLVTAYVAGPSLDRAVAAYGPWPGPMVRRLGAGLAEALTAIHGCGLVHRDLKPGNVLLAADGPRVIDFGISRAMDGTALTRHGSLLGTPAYMAPEQVRARGTPTTATDVFALGGVLFFTATGRPPFGSGPVTAVLERIERDEPDLSVLPEPLRPVVAACLAKDPGRRPDAPALLGLLSAAGDDGEAWLPGTLAAELARMQPTVDVRTGSSRMSRRTFLAAGAAGAVVAGGVAGAVVLTRRRADGGRPPGRPAVPGGDPSAGGVVQAGTGPAALWSVRTPGRQAGMVLAGDVLVLATTSGPAGLDAATGRIRWARGGTPLAALARIELAAAGGVAYVPNVMGAIDRYAVGTGRSLGLLTARPSAVARQVGDVTGGLVHAWGDGTGGAVPSGSLFALDARSGAVRWRREIAYSCRPVVSGDVIYAVDAGDRVVALDARTGAVRWSVPGATGQTVAVTGGVVAAVLGALTGLDGATGAVRWRAHGRTGPPAAGAGWICAATDRDLEVFDAAGGRRSAVRLPARPSAQDAPATSSQLAAVPLDPAGGGTGFTLVDAARGRVRWTRRTPGDTQTSWSLLVTDARVYASDGISVEAYSV